MKPIIVAVLAASLFLIPVDMSLLFASIKKTGTEWIHSGLKAITPNAKTNAMLQTIAEEQFVHGGFLLLPF